MPIRLNPERNRYHRYVSEAILVVAAVTMAFTIFYVMIVMPYKILKHFLESLYRDQEASANLHGAPVAY